jgi:EmrB/QacA subfamily drug resistance transporter
MTATLTPTSEDAPRTARQRTLALYVLCTGMLMIILDGTIVNVALPSIQTDLGFSQSSLAWVVNAYLIPFGGLLLLAGRLGDLVGRKRLFSIGLVLFVAASALCGFATSQALLVGARFLQGIGGAMTSAVILGMIVTMFPEQREQAKAIGVYSFVASAGASIGLLLGGVLTEAINWHWIFFVNVPIGVVTAVLAGRLVERDEGIGLAKGADLPGATLITSALMLGVYTIVEIPQEGWSSPRTLGLGAVSLALLAGFVARQHTAATPLAPLRVFRSRNVSGANVVQVLMVAGLFGMFFLGALYLQGIQGYDPVQVGLAFLPVALLIGSVSLKVADRVILRFGARRTLVAGLLAVLGGLLLFTRAPLEATYVTDVLPTMVLFGIGAGLSFPAMVTLAMSGATPEDAGLASGLVNTSQQVGGALGLAVLATLSSTRTEDRLGQGLGKAAALVDGYQLAFFVAAGFVAVAIALAATVLEHAEPGIQPDIAELPDAEPAEGLDVGYRDAA